MEWEHKTAFVMTLHGDVLLAWFAARLGCGGPLIPHRIKSLWLQGHHDAYIVYAEYEAVTCGQGICYKIIHA